MIVLKYIVSKDNIWWYEAPLPRRWHRCFVQTEGKYDDGVVVQRCACGAIRSSDGLFTTRWENRNDRRKK